MDKRKASVKATATIVLFTICLSSFPFSPVWARPAPRPQVTGLGPIPTGVALVEGLRRLVNKVASDLKEAVDSSVYGYIDGFNQVAAERIADFERRLQRQGLLQIDRLDETARENVMNAAMEARRLERQLARDARQLAATLAATIAKLPFSDRKSVLLAIDDIYIGEHPGVTRTVEAIGYFPKGTSMISVKTDSGAITIDGKGTGTTQAYSFSADQIRDLLVTMNRRGSDHLEASVDIPYDKRFFRQGQMSYTINVHRAAVVSQLVVIVAPRKDSIANLDGHPTQVVVFPPKAGTPEAFSTPTGTTAEIYYTTLGSDEFQRIDLNEETPHLTTAWNGETLTLIPKSAVASDTWTSLELPSLNAYARPCNNDSCPALNPIEIELRYHFPEGTALDVRMKGTLGRVRGRADRPEVLLTVIGFQSERHAPEVLGSLDRRDAINELPPAQRASITRTYTGTMNATNSPLIILRTAGCGGDPSCSQVLENLKFLITRSAPVHPIAKAQKSSI